MKRINLIVSAALVLSFVSTTNTSAQWVYRSNYSEGLACVQDANHKWGFIDKTGKVVIPCQWKYANDFREGMATVEDNNKWGLIDKTGKVISPCQWETAEVFSDNFTSVRLKSSER